MTPPKKAAGRAATTYVLTGHPQPGAVPEPIRDRLHLAHVGDTITLNIPPAKLADYINLGIIAPAGGEGP